MKDDLQNKLVEILASIQGAVSTARDFALDQLPDVAQSYIAYGRASSLVGTLLAVGLFVLGVALWRRYRMDGRAGDLAGSIFDYLGGGYVLGACIMAVAMCAFGLFLNQALLVWIAPKVWLLKEIAALVR